MALISIEPIGYVRSPYIAKYDAPRQPGADDRVDEAVIDLLPHRNLEQAVEDLAGFDRIWVIAWFDQATNWKPKVLTPRDRTKRGVLATRSPHRPNPLSLSAVRLVDVKGLTIRVEGLDLLDGTPVLDIKPYIPYADAFPESRTGWLEGLNERQYTVDIICDVSAVDPHVIAHAKRVLGADPFPHPYRRTSLMESGSYMLAYKEWRAVYDIDGENVIVRSIVLQST